MIENQPNLNQPNLLNNRNSYCNQIELTEYKHRRYLNPQQLGNFSCVTSIVSATWFGCSNFVWDITWTLQPPPMSNLSHRPLQNPQLSTV